MNTRRTVADLAYALWQARGRPEGSAEVDWAEAERQVMAARPTETSEAATPPVHASTSPANTDSGELL